MIKAIKLLRIYTDEDAYLGDRRVFEVIASRARDTGLAGITVLEARLGFGRSAHIHKRRIFENGRALVIEIVADEIGRASCRERVCKYVYTTVVAVSLKIKKN